MTRCMMKTIRAAVSNSRLFSNWKSIDVTSEKKSRFFVRLTGFESDNHTCEFIGVGLNELNSIDFREIVFDELGGLVLLQTDFRNLVELLVECDDFAIHFK